MKTEANDQGGVGVQAWDPRRQLKRVDPREAQLSRGFLRSRPERWFPGFSAHWLPLAHALASDARISEVKPIASIPKGLDFGFVGSVDDEPIGMFVDRAEIDAFIEEVTPGGLLAAREVVTEYFARRFLASLAQSWSGPESSSVRFERDMQPNQVNVHGAIKVILTINTSQCIVYLGLGRRLVERIDGLWRRQVHSTAGSKTQTGKIPVSIELVQVGVPPQMLSDYLKQKTLVDLEVGVTDMCVLRSEGRVLMPARIVDVGGKIGCEITPGPVAATPQMDGATRLSVELGSVEIEGSSLSEYTQAGSILVTDLPLKDVVQLIINGERVGQAQLCTFEGRFAISVI